MGDENQTIEIQFHFHPFSPILEVQMLISVAFLLIYIGSLIGNTTIFLTVWAEHLLHTPMYFFLANLAVLETFYSSTVAPLALVSFLTLGRILISFTGCGTQMFFLVFLGSADCILLGIMAYDRFVAIRDPFCYSFLRRWQLWWSVYRRRWEIWNEIFRLPALISLRPSNCVFSLSKGIKKYPQATNRNCQWHSEGLSHLPRSLKPWKKTRARLYKW